MTDDFRDFAAFPRRWERPSTSYGRWSLRLLVGFVALMRVIFHQMGDEPAQVEPLRHPL